MNNEEKILAMLVQMNSRFDKVDSRLDKVDLKLDEIQEDIEILKEDTAITRESTEMLLDWATVIDHVTLEEIRKQRIARTALE